MSKRFDEVLNRCLDRIPREDPVETCLASHPEHARDLEAPLRAAAQVHAAAAFTPGEAARVRGRHRIMAEMDALSRGPSTAAPAGKPAWSGIFSVLGGGPTLVAASSRSLPGDILYPVKEKVEQTRLAFQLSQEGQADLHLAFSERRMDEMSKLIALGETDSLPAVQEKLDPHLRSVQAIADKLDDLGLWLVSR